jgi:hypothetical protein
MTTSAWRRSATGRAAVAVVGFLPAQVTRLRRRPPPEPVALALLALLAVGMTLGSRVVGAALLPTSMLVVPVLGAGLLLSRRPTRWLLVVVAACLAHNVVTEGVSANGVRPGVLVVLAVTAGVAYEFARSREETGLSGATGEGVLVELRQRLEQQGALPALPPPWRADALVCPADGGPFAGDFVASSLTSDGRCLEVVLVDVSGKGVAAGTRALLLSGALGGLLGAVAPDDFLPAANDYLQRQEWVEGFATAVHVVLSLGDGAFRVAGAGHPPPALFDAGSGRWSLVEAGGPALGLLSEVSYEPVTGRLERGDALLLYTDGLVEIPGRDLAVGTDRLLGAAERLVTRGFEQGAEALIASVPTGAADDRGVVLLRHSG